MQLQQCNCSIRVTAVLEYLVSAFTYTECVTISYFNCASIMNAPRHRILGHKQDKDDPCIIYCAICGTPKIICQVMAVSNCKTQTFSYFAETCLCEDFCQSVSHSI